MSNQGPEVSQLSALSPAGGGEGELKAPFRMVAQEDGTKATEIAATVLGVCTILLLAELLIAAAYPDWGAHREPALMRSLVAVLFAAWIFAAFQQVSLRRVRSQLRAHKATIFNLRERADWFEKLAVLDPLTELFNRRYGNEYLAREIARARRMKYPLTVLLIDLNDFKRLNDAYGHAVGDQALRTFARYLKRGIRSSDIPVRMGGDEFMVILPECHKYSVPTALVRLRKLALTVRGAEISMTFSSGWAELHEGESPEQLLERADHALYADKRSGSSQEQVQRVAAEVERGSKLQLLGQLTGQVAHDFNNLLTIIKGYSEMALPKLDPDDSARLKVAQIAKAADHASHLIGQLRVFTRKDAHEWDVIEVNERVHDVMALLHPLLGPKIRLSVVTGPPAHVRTRAGQIEQILLNLVTNAKDAVAGEGTIAIETHAAALDEEFARAHPGSRAGSYVAISVKDDGTGIDEAIRARIFEPYFTTKAHGTGLGLVTVYGLVKQMGGYIDVESAPGQGARFVAYLPLLPDEPKKPSPSVHSPIKS